MDSSSCAPTFLRYFLSPITLETTSSMHFFTWWGMREDDNARKKKKTFLCCYSPPHKHISRYEWCDDVCALCTLSCEKSWRRMLGLQQRGVKRMQTMDVWVSKSCFLSLTNEIMRLNIACTFTCHIATITKSSSRRLRGQRKCINSHSNWHMNFL